MNLKRLLNKFTKRSVSSTERASIDYFSSFERDATTLVSLGAKSLSHAAVNDLVLRATGGDSNWGSLRNDVLKDPNWTPGRSWDSELIVGAVLLNGVIDPTEDAFDLASRTLLGVLKIASPEDWTPELLMLSYHAGTIVSNRPVLDQLMPYCKRLPGVLWATRADLALPERSQLGNDANHQLTENTATWWKVFNEPFVKDGLEAWDLIPQKGTETMFPWIHAPKVSSCEIPEDSQALVSIVVPVYRPDAGFLNTIESLIRQSWQNIEIVVVDDASPTGGEIIQRAVELDARIRLVTMSQNSGAYRARNAGFDAAQGEFVTVLDADDLSHSRRIELQVKALMDHPDAMASGIAGIRMYADGVLTMYGFYASRRNYSAFLFRRVPVMDALGKFDDVRKSGDVEFHARLQAVFGADTIVQVRKHLSITQLTPGSLSRNDSRYVWLAGERLAYSNQYRGWHRTALSEGNRGALKMDKHRSFVAPAAFVGETAPDTFSVALLRDWSADVGGAEVSELAMLVGNDFQSGRVALMQGVHPQLSSASRNRVGNLTWDAVESGNAMWLPWSRKAKVGTLLISDSSYALWLPSREFVGVEVDEIRIVRSSVEPKSSLPQDNMVEERCIELFGVRPQWINVG